MDIQYHCRHTRRRQEVRLQTSINGIEYLEVLDNDAPPGSPRQQTLLVQLIHPLDGVVEFDASNVEITGGVRVKPINVEWAARGSDADTLLADSLISPAERDLFLERDQPDAGDLLVVRTDSSGDYSTYRLSLVDDDAPLATLDTLLASVDFSFKVECPSEFDCAPEEECPPEPIKLPPIDYLAKDYASFRQLMLDRMSVVMPDWKERNPADVEIALVEVLAYAADRLSYYQDAVGTEAYLGTSRRRPSVRRHARLLDYRMHDGCNARTWVTVRADDGVQNVILPREYLPDQTTKLLTRIPSEGPTISDDDLPEILVTRKPEVFELMHDLRLFDVHNDLKFYTWGDEECCLPRHATKATLRDDPDARLLLAPGDVIIIEEVRGSTTGQEADADPNHRHAVRLTRVDPPAVLDEDGNRSAGPIRTDDLFDQPVVDIEWSVDDAIPFPVCISARLDVDGIPTLFENMSVARGNVVLVDHGQTLTNHQLDVDTRYTEQLEPPTGDRLYRPGLKLPGQTMRVPFDDKAWLSESSAEVVTSARAALSQDVRDTLPAVELLSAEEEDWKPESDLLGSDRFDTDFVVEVMNDGSASVRFGDNVYGKIPEEDVALYATYRVGNGPDGNVGAEAISHIVTTPGLGIASPVDGDPAPIRNPIPAEGGTRPESLDEVRLYAPQAFRRQDRAVTEKDYAAIAEQHNEVQKGVATRRWTGSWHTMFITTDRTFGREVDRDFEDALSAFVEPYQLAGHDVEIEPPRFVSLEIAMTVCVDAGYIRANVKEMLLEVFSSVDLPDGRRGYFHPDNLTFGQPIYLSPLIAAAMGVPGVQWVKIDPSSDPPGAFKRWGEPPQGELDDGFITMGRYEIPRLDNDPNQPENGKIEFHMEGGL